ncbi:MAG: divergent polysaccharide deacetylase family protein [Magnetococcales bacterium]|nr:divergent polysaccharide deacetylase family protein [Magnetococcales bacterium]
MTADQTRHASRPEPEIGPDAPSPFQSGSALMDGDGEQAPESQTPENPGRDEPGVPESTAVHPTAALVAEPAFTRVGDADPSGTQESDEDVPLDEEALDSRNDSGERLEDLPFLEDSTLETNFTSGVIPSADDMDIILVADSTTAESPAADDIFLVADSTTAESPAADDIFLVADDRIDAFLPPGSPVQEEATLPSESDGLLPDASEDPHPEREERASAQPDEDGALPPSASFEKSASAEEENDRPVTLLKRVYLPEADAPESDREERLHPKDGAHLPPPGHAMRQEIDYEPVEENDYDPATNRWWILPLVAGVVFFLAGVGTGRFLDGFGWPFGREAAHADKQTLVTMAVPPPGVPGALSGTNAPGSVNDAGPPVTTPGKGESTPAKESAPRLESIPNAGTPPVKESAPHGETGPLSDEVTAQPQPPAGEEPHTDLQYEESLPHEPTPEEVPPATPPDTKGGPPRVAVVIDDLGYNGPVSLAIAKLPEAITLAILPGGDFSRQVVTIGQSTHKEIILHQPMEPLGYPRIKPGPGALLNGMGHDELQTILIRNLEKYPEVTGINNHMGSRLTQNREAMDTVMGVLKGRKLFFLDSRTSQTSVGYARAKTNGVPAARRDVFLDNVQKVSAIETRLAELERIARHTGRAIGIGHPHAETLAALRNWLPGASKRGVRIEGISHFLTGDAGQARPVPALDSAREPSPDKSALNNKPVKLKSETQLGHPLGGERPLPVPSGDATTERPAPPINDTPIDRPGQAPDNAPPMERPTPPSTDIKPIEKSAPPQTTVKPPVRPAQQPQTTAKPPVRPSHPPVPYTRPPGMDEPMPAPPIIIRSIRPPNDSSSRAGSSTLIQSPSQPPQVLFSNKPSATQVAPPAAAAPPPAPPAPVKPVNTPPAPKPKPIPLDPDDPATPPPVQHDSHEYVLPVDRQP